MLFTPTASAELAQAAVRVLPEPVSATDEQPDSELPLAVKATVPVGAVPVTLAVKLTLWPCVDGLTELASAVVVGVSEPPAVTLTSSCVVVERRRISMVMPCVLSV